MFQRPTHEQQRPSPAAGGRAHTWMICTHQSMQAAQQPPEPDSALCALLREGICCAASFKVRELICPCIAWAADLDGAFAVTGMQPVSRGGADRCSRGGPSEGRLSMSAASRPRRRGRALLEHRGSVRVPQVLYRWWARMASAGWQLAGSPCRLGAAR